MSGSSRYEIDIIANNKASAALGKVNKQLKTIQKSTKTANGGFNKMKIAAGAAAAAFAGFKLGKAFLDTAKQFEQLGIQLKFIAGSAEAGARALGIVEKAAKRSAFSLEQMALSAPLLLNTTCILWWYSGSRHIQRERHKSYARFPRRCGILSRRN